MPEHCNLNDGDILLSLTGNVGRVCMVYGKDLLLNQRVAKLEPKKSYYTFVYGLFRSPDFKIGLQNLAVGAAQQNLSPVQTSELPVVIPPTEILDAYGILAEPMLKDIVELNKQNYVLRQARDLLLPKLVTGEIEVRSESIPKDELMSYLNKLFDKTKDNRLADDKVRSRIIEMMNEACEITELSFSDLLQRLDFKPNNLSIEALESFLAELRSIFWLRDFGFVSIEPLQAMKKSIRPDFIAKHGDRTC